MDPLSNWTVDKYQDRKIIPFPSGTYDSFSSEIKRYITDLVDQMSLGSKMKNHAFDFASNIYWEPARPSTLAGVCVLMAGSFNGFHFDSFLIDISKKQRKMKYSLEDWKEKLENKKIFGE